MDVLYTTRAFATALPSGYPASDAVVVMPYFAGGSATAAYLCLVSWAKLTMADLKLLFERIVRLICTVCTWSARRPPCMRLPATAVIAVMLTDSYVPPTCSATLARVAYRQAQHMRTAADSATAHTPSVHPRSSSVPAVTNTAVTTCWYTAVPGVTLRGNIAVSISFVSCSRETSMPSVSWPTTAAVGLTVGDVLGPKLGDAVGCTVGDDVGLGVSPGVVGASDWLDGKVVGLADGEAVGIAVGLVVGLVVGDAVGAALGEPDGETVGLSDGDIVGLSDGDPVGFSVGDHVCPATVGPSVGLTVGAVGPVVGASVGDAVGIDEGAVLGLAVTALHAAQQTALNCAREHIPVFAICVQLSYSPPLNMDTVAGLMSKHAYSHS